MSRVARRAAIGRAPARRRAERCRLLRSLRVGRPAAAAAPSGVGRPVDRSPGTITVFAAASLTEAFTTLGKQFEAAHPGTKVRVQLRPQLGPGPPDHRRARRPTCSPRRARRTWTRSSGRRAPRDADDLREERRWRSPCRRPTRPASPRSRDLAKHGREGGALPGRRCRAAPLAAKVFDNAKLTVTAGHRRRSTSSRSWPRSARRGRRRRRLRHRRAGRGRQGQGHRDPGRRQRLDLLPDRRADRGAEPGRRRRRSSTTCSPPAGRRCSTAAGFAQRREPARTATGPHAAPAAGRGAVPWPLASRRRRRRVPAAAAGRRCWSGRRGAALPGSCRRARSSTRCGCRWCAPPPRRRSSLVLGVPLAWVLARARFPGRGLLRALVTLPLVLPPVVGGVALLLAFGRQRLRRPVARRSGSASPCRSPPPGVVRRRDVRGDAVPRRHASRARSAAADRELRGGRRHPRRVPADRVPPGHAAAGRAVAGGRRGAVLGPGARRVRRHHHLRRQLPGPHADHAAGGLPGAARPTRRRPSRSRWCCCSSSVAGAGRAARPLAAGAGGRVG